MHPKNIVLLHGWGANTAKLKALSEKLAGLGWKTYLPELPGFDAPDPKSPMFLDDYAKWVVTKSNNKFKNRYFVFGHSFGGRIAIKIATKDTRLPGLILCAAGGLSRASLIKRVFFAGLSKAGKVLKIVPNFYKYFRIILYKLAREKDYFDTKGVMSETFKNVISENLRPLLPGINTSTLVLWGTDDSMTPIKDAYLLEDKLKDVKLVVFSGCGHTLPYDKPALLAKKINQWYKSLI